MTIFRESSDMRLRQCFWIVLAIILSGMLLTAAHAGQLLAGAARVSITPGAEEFPYEGPDGYQFVGVHDKIYTRALVLDDGSQRVAIVIIDATRVPRPDEILGALARELVVPEHNLLVAASHTHDVPLAIYNGGEPNPVQLKEIERIEEAAVQAVRQARAQLQSARIAFVRGEAWVSMNGGNYQQVDENGNGRMQDGLYFPEDPSDKSLDLLRLENLEGEALALLVNYPTHGEVMFKSITREGGYEVSGDLPGAVARLLEEHPAGAPVVLFTSPAEANQRPLYQAVQHADKWLDRVDPGDAGWVILDVQARRLATSVLDTLAGMPAGISDVKLNASAGTAVCPGKEKFAQPNETSEEVPPVSIPLSMIRINDIALAGVGGDVANEIGQHFKEASSLADTTLISMTAGYIGYIMSDHYYEDRGHGISSGVAKSPLQSGCAESAIIKGLLDLMEKNRREDEEM
jgi:hypothetical protein